MGGPHHLMSSKCSGITVRCLLLVTGDEAFVAEKIGEDLVVLVNSFQGVCGSWPGLTALLLKIVQKEAFGEGFTGSEGGNWGR